MDTDNAKGILVDRFDEMTATLNKVLCGLASLMPKSTSGPEEGKKMQDNSSTNQAKNKGKSIDKTVKRVRYEKCSSEEDDDSDSFEYESAPDTPPPRRGKRAHGLPLEVSSESEDTMNKVTVRAAFKRMTEHAKPDSVFSKAISELAEFFSMVVEVGKPITEGFAKIASGALQRCPAEDQGQS